MAQAEGFAAALLQLADDDVEALKLQIVEGIARLVGDGHMREDAGDVQIRQLHGGEQIVQMAGVHGVEARSAHAGLELEMRLQTVLRAGEMAAEPLGIVQRGDRLRDVEIHEVDGDVRRLRAQKQDLRADAGGAELLGLVIVVHGDPAAAELLQQLRHAHRAVAVAVGLADAEHLAVIRQMRTDLAVVMLQGAETDLHPGSNRPVHQNSPSLTVSIA